MSRKFELNVISDADDWEWVGCFNAIIVVLCCNVLTYKKKPNKNPAKKNWQIFADFKNAHISLLNRLSGLSLLVATFLFF